MIQNTLDKYPPKWQMIQTVNDILYSNKMDQTEKYLNSILEKRLGSVINQSAFSKNANTVTRIPREEEKVQSMPTVFRKQYETVLVQQSQRANSVRITMKEEQAAKQENQKPMGSHRVEYMTISKRLSSKKQDDYISPTVDISKYQRKQQRQQALSHKGIKLEQIAQQRGQQRVKRESEGQSGKPKRRKIFS